jgi:hypothetical protein
MLYNMRYYQLDPGYIISDITGWAQHIKYTIIMVGPRLSHLQHYSLGPAYQLCDITSLACQIHHVILLHGPRILHPRHWWMQSAYILFHIRCVPRLYLWIIPINSCGRCLLSQAHQTPMAFPDPRLSTQCWGPRPNQPT